MRPWQVTDCTGQYSRAGDLGHQAGLARAGGAGQEQPVPAGVVQEGQDVPQDLVAEHIGLAHRDLRMVLVGEAEDFQARAGLDAEGRRDIEALCR